MGSGDDRAENHRRRVSRFRNFSRRVASDLDETVGWLLDRSGAAAAEQLLTTVLAGGERLAEHPLLGRRRGLST